MFKWFADGYAEFVSLHPAANDGAKILYYSNA